MSDTKLRGYAVMLVGTICHVSVGAVFASLEQLRANRKMSRGGISITLDETTFYEIDQWAKAHGYKQPKERRRVHPQAS